VLEHGYNLLEKHCVGYFHAFLAIKTGLLTAYPRDTDNFEAPVRFLLQSKAVEQSSTLVQQDNSGMNDSVEAESIETENKSNQRPKIEGKMTASSSSIMKMKRKRKVMFADEVEVPERGAKLVATASSSNLNSSTTGSGPSINLCAIKSACEYLRQHCGCPEAVTTYGYFAYFQKRTLSKYIFYVSANHLVSHESTTSLSSYNMSLHDFLLAEQEETVTNVHQFKLALKLALAVLQYHSTPWLRGEWRLSQLMLTTDPSRLPDHFTLYLNSSLIPTPPTPPTTPEASIHNEVQMIEAPKKGRLSEAQRRGINNTTLFCLGLALLEISHWKQLSSLIEDYDTDEIDTARRLSNSNSVLGRRYDEIVRKCLQCNFGFGTDLGRTELQSAVYSDVVCPLEELIEKLDDLSI
jgi:hypothetical protein